MIEFIFNCFDICNQILNYTGLYLINKWYEIMKHKTKLPSFFSLPIRDLNDYYLKKIIDWQIQNGDLLDPETRLISLDIKESAIKEQFRRNIPIGIPIGISSSYYTNDRGATSAFGGDRGAASTVGSDCVLRTFGGYCIAASAFGGYLYLPAKQPPFGWARKRNKRLLL